MGDAVPAPDSDEVRHIRREAGRLDVRPHALRRYCALVAAMNGVDLPTIARLLGYALVETTSRCAHLPNRPVVAANRVSGRMDTAMAE